MEIQIGSIIVSWSGHRSTNIKGIVTDICTIENSIYYRIVCNGYDQWIHKSQIINTITNEADTVILHLNDLYK